MDIPDTFSSIICGKEYHGGCDPRVIPPFFVSTRRSGQSVAAGAVPSGSAAPKSLADCAAVLTAAAVALPPERPG